MARLYKGSDFVASSTNVRTLYGVGMGVSLVGVYATQEEAQAEAAKIEPVYSHHSWGSANYHYAYTITFEPGDLKMSEFYDGMGCMLNAENNGQAFDYFNVVGCKSVARAFNVRKSEFTNEGNRIAYKDRTPQTSVFATVFAKAGIA